MLHPKMNQKALFHLTGQVNTQVIILKKNIYFCYLNILFYVKNMRKIKVKTASMIFPCICFSNLPRYVTKWIFLSSKEYLSWDISHQVPCNKKVIIPTLSVTIQPCKHVLYSWQLLSSVKTAKQERCLNCLCFVDKVLFMCNWHTNHSWYNCGHQHTMM